MPRYKDFADGNIFGASDVNGIQDWVIGNFVDTNAFGIPLGRPIAGARYKRVSCTNISTASFIAYTVPAGYIALVGAPLPSSAGANSVFSEWIVPNGGATATSNLRMKVTVPAGTNGPRTGAALLSAGDTIWAQGTVAGPNCIWPVIEFPASAPLVGARLGAVPTADTLFYTCPSGKTARLFGLLPDYASMAVIDSSGGGSNGLRVKFKPNGGAAGLIWSTNPTPDGQVQWGMSGITLAAGDSILVSATVANAINVWAVFVEM